MLGVHYEINFINVLRVGSRRQFPAALQIVPDDAPSISLTLRPISFIFTLFILVLLFARPSMVCASVLCLAVLAPVVCAKAQI